MKKELLISMGCILAFGLSVIPASLNAQTKKSAKVLYFEEEEICFGGAFYSVSPNGQYAVGYSEDFSGCAFLWNRESGGITLLNGGAYEDCAQATAVSNNCVIAGNFKDENTLSDKYGTPCIPPGYWKDGQWTKLPRVKNIPNIGQEMDGAANAISADGKIICGYVPLSPSNTRMAPAIWIDGELQIVSDEEILNMGSMAYCVASEGKLVGGRACHDDGSCSPALWIDGKLDRLDGKISATELSEETGEDEPFFEGLTKCISENGEYAVGYFDAEGTGYTSQSFIWSKDGGLEYITDGLATFVTNDKTVYGSSSYMGNAYIYKDGVARDLDEYLTKEYNFEPEANYVPMSAPLGVSADGKTIVGWAVEVISDLGAIMKPMIILLEEEESSIDTEGTDHFSLASNVVSDYLQINGSYCSAQVYNAVGALVTSDTQMNGSVNLANLVSGIYFVKVSNGTQTGTYKVIKK